MGKKLVGALLAALFLFSAAGSAMAKMNCTVEAVREDSLVLKGCSDHKQLGKMKAGSHVSVAISKKKAAAHVAK